MLAADAYLIGCSENFGGMAGQVKDFLERIYYPCEARIEARAWSAFVCAGNDGTGAMRDLDRVAKGLRLRKVHPGIVHRSGRVASTHPVAEERARRVSRARRDARGGTRRRALVARGPSARVALPRAGGHALDQRVARRLDQVQHALEAIRAAVVRIGHFAHVELLARRRETAPGAPSKARGRNAARSRRFAWSIARIQPKRWKSSVATCRARRPARS